MSYIIPPWGSREEYIENYKRNIEFFEYLCKKYKSREACDFAEFLKKEFKT